MTCWNVRTWLCFWVFAVCCGTSSLSRADSTVTPVPQRKATPAQTRFEAGNTALSKQDLGVAEAAFKESVKLDPKAAGPVLGLALVSAKRGQKTAAEQYFKQALALEPNSAEVQTRWGQYLYSQHDIPQAEGALKKAVSLDAKAVAARVNLGDLYLTAYHKPDEAIKEYRAALEVTPDHAGAHYALALALLSKNDSAKGEAELIQAAKLAPANPLPQNALGRLYAGQKQYDKALNSFDAALKASPSFAAAHLERGDVFSIKGDDDNALKEYAAALKSNPNLPDAQVLIGMVQQRRSRWAEAQQAYLAAIKINPNVAVAYNNLAWMAAERKVDLDQALQWANKAVGLAPKVPEFVGTLGWVQYAKGDLTKSAQTLQTAAALKPERAAVVYHLAIVHIQQGKKKEAIKELKKALSLDANFQGADDARKRLKDLGQG